MGTVLQEEKGAGDWLHDIGDYLTLLNCVHLQIVKMINFTLCVTQLFLSHSKLVMGCVQIMKHIQMFTAVLPGWWGGSLSSLLSS